MAQKVLWRAEQGALIKNNVDLFRGGNQQRFLRGSNCKKQLVMNRDLQYHDKTHKYQKVKNILMCASRTELCGRRMGWKTVAGSAYEGLLTFHTKPRGEVFLNDMEITAEFEVGKLYNPMFTLKDHLYHGSGLMGKFKESWRSYCRGQKQGIMVNFSPEHWQQKMEINVWFWTIL